MENTTVCACSPRHGLAVDCLWLVFFLLSFVYLFFVSRRDLGRLISLRGSVVHVLLLHSSLTTFG
jgi:hypothetical protein